MAPALPVSRIWRMPPMAKTPGSAATVSTATSPPPPQAGVQQCPHDPPHLRYSEGFVREICGAKPLRIVQILNLFNSLLDPMRSPAPSAHTFSVLFSAMARGGHYGAVVSLYGRLARSADAGAYAQGFTRGIVINYCCRMGRLDVGLGVLGDMLKRGLSVATEVVNVLINGLCVEGRISDAEEMFERMPEMGCAPNIFTYNTFIKGLCRRGKNDIALGMLRSMQSQEGCCKPDVVGYSTSDKWEQAIEILKMVSEHRISPDVATFNVLVNYLCKQRRIRKALALFEFMVAKGVKPDRLGMSLDIFSYNSLIHGYCSLGKWERAVQLFNEMMDQGIPPNIVTFNTLLDGLCKEGKVRKAQELFTTMGESQMDKVHEQFDCSSVLAPNG
ncbi:hypothetical protein Taro_043331 [Colocasia esculenta]|uniref:Pentatricopeptide repeat-containing protein n=1 Tax=Colocasia esculenta TaxID=4460 RepID=A0A843X1B1_COLES|nr:hypothetical protein [Colocasia esculenta]